MIHTPLNKDILRMNGGENDVRMCQSRPGRGEVSHFYFFRIRGCVEGICVVVVVCGIENFRLEKTTREKVSSKVSNKVSKNNY